MKVSEILRQYRIYKAYLYYYGLPDDCATIKLNDLISLVHNNISPEDQQDLLHQSHGIAEFL